MTQFGQIVPVTGPNPLEQREEVWSSTVRILKSAKNGQVVYDYECPYPNNDNHEIDVAVREALDNLVKQLPAKTGS